MRAMFLKRNYIEKSKKSGRSMVVLDVFELPRLRDDGTGEMTQGQARNYFIMDEQSSISAKAACSATLSISSSSWTSGSTAACPFP